MLAAVGHWSDLVGRRALILPAVCLAASGDAIFATANSFGQLAAGRAVQGIAVGLATGAAGAALGDLLPTTRRWPPSSPWPARPAGWPWARWSAPRSRAAHTPC